MEFIYCVGFCASCNRHLLFNPHLVPSVKVDGVREPICERCFDQWNSIHRTEKGLDPIPLDPQAYTPTEEV